MATPSLRPPPRLDAPRSSTSPPSSRSYQRPRRYSTIPSAFLEKFHEIEMKRNLKAAECASALTSGPRKVTFVATAGPSKPSALPTISSLKSRLVRKRPSAPVLSKSLSNSPIVSSPLESPTTPTATDMQDSHSQLDSISLRARSNSRDDHARPSSSSSASQTPRPRRQLRHSASIEGRLMTAVDARGYRKLDWLRRREGMSLHPYEKDEAPYMLGFNPTLLLNDAYTHLLLRQLNTHGGPSFYDYDAKPPRNVLDIGCGQGTWAMEAAAAWGRSGTMITGFDLVDVLSDQARSCTGVKWMRGNFVQYPLPFRSGSFDLVRIANMSLCIPYARWQHVLQEVKRVLSQGGRVELIDDEIIFPYSSSNQHAISSASQPQSARTSWSSEKSTSSRQSSGQQSSTSPSSDDYPDSFLDLGFSSEYSEPPTPGLYHGNTSSEASCEDLHTPTDENISTGPWQSAKARSIGDGEPSSPVLHSTSLNACREVEQMFQSMLESTFGVHPRPHEFLLDALNEVFGEDANARKMRSFHMSLVKAGENDDVSGESKGRSAKRWPLADRDSTEEVESIKRVNREQLAQAQQQGKLTAKAARLLGVAAVDENFPSVRSSLHVSDNSEFGSAAPSLRASPSFKSLSSRMEKLSQSKLKYRQGLLVYPNQFLETTERELDMYVSKNIHVILGCRAALSDYVVANAVDPTSSTAYKVLQDMLWEYESTRRERLGLSDLNIMVGKEYEAPIDPLMANVKRPKYLTPEDAKQTFAGALNGENPPRSSTVRSIRVYEAYKAYANIP